MIIIRIFASGEASTLKQSTDVTVKGNTQTRIDGMFSFDLPAPGTYNVIVKSSGYMTWQGDITFGQYANIQDITLIKSMPAPEGYTGYCTIGEYWLSFGKFFNVQHPDLGIIKSGYSSIPAAQYMAHIDNRCFVRYPPAPSPEEIIIQKVLSQVSGQIETALGNALLPIQNTVNGINSLVTTTVTDLVAPVKQTISDIDDKFSDALDDILERFAEGERKFLEDLAALEQKIITAIPVIVEGAFISILEKVLEQDVKR